MTAHDTLTKPTPTHVINALDATRELVRAGWCQNVARRIDDGRQRHCLLGALARSCGTVRLSGRTVVDGEVIPGEWIREAALVALKNSLPPLFARWHSLVVFNDSPQTTRDDVIALINRAMEMVARAVG